MKKIFIVILIVNSVLYVGCQDKNDIESESTERTDEDNEIDTSISEVDETEQESKISEEENLNKISPKKAEEIISERMKFVIKAIAENDMEGFSIFVHPVKGVRFSPISKVHLDGYDLVFSKDSIRSFFEDDKKYTWGAYIGSGELIVLTKKEYFNTFVYDLDYINADIIAYNEFNTNGSMYWNDSIWEVYPNTVIVEFFKEEEYQSLSIVFEEYEKEWFVVGFIFFEWVI